MITDTIIGDRDACLDRLARDFRNEHARAAAERGHFAVAVPGGSVALHTFPVLASLDLDWSRIEVFWVDERAVPPTDRESNYRLAESLWLRPAGVPSQCVHRMPADEPDLHAAAVMYGDEISRVLGPSRRFDYVLLGVGPDGHVASLFPGHAALQETERSVVAIDDAPKLPPHRLTLTLPILTSAGRVAVVAFGESKAHVLGEACTREDSPLPVSQVLRRSARPLLVVDPAAGARIG